MVSGGHNKKSADEHRANGTFRKDRHANKSKTGWPGKPIKPAELQDDAVASNFWDSVVASLPPGTLRAADSPGLEVLCRYWAELTRLGAELRNVKPSDKRYRSLVTTYRQLAASFDRLAKQFGMTPATRGGVKIQEATTLKIHDPLENMFAERDARQTPSK